MGAAFLIAIAVSIDSFSIGIAYGIKGLKVPMKSIFIIAFISFTTVLLSMKLGDAIANLMTEYGAKVVSSIILLFLAFWMWKQNKQDKRDVDDVNNKDPYVIAKIRLKPLGVVISILKEPSKADVDISGIIESKEALLLGIALSLDSLGVGIGAAVAGASMLFTPIFVVIFSMVFIMLGISIGQRQKLGLSKSNKVNILSSLILISVAIIRIIK